MVISEERYQPCRKVSSVYIPSSKDGRAPTLHANRKPKVCHVFCVSVLKTCLVCTTVDPAPSAGRARRSAECTQSKLREHWLPSRECSSTSRCGTWVASIVLGYHVWGGALAAWRNVVLPCSQWMSETLRWEECSRGLRKVDSLECVARACRYRVLCCLEICEVGGG